MIDGVFDGENFLGHIVGNFDAEFFLESHHQLNGIQAVGAKIVNKTGRIRDFVFFHTKVFDYDLFYAIGDITHVIFP